jgi:hypothetical protein
MVSKNSIIVSVTRAIWGKKTILTIVILILFIIGIVVYLNQPKKFTLNCEDYDINMYKCVIDIPRGYDSKFGLSVVNMCLKRDNPTYLDCAKHVFSRGDCTDFSYSVSNVGGLIAYAKCKPTIQVNLEGKP